MWNLEALASDGLTALQLHYLGKPHEIENDFRGTGWKTCSRGQITKYGLLKAIHRFLSISQIYGAIVFEKFRAYK